MEMNQILKILRLSPDVAIPAYATRGDSGFDLIVNNFKTMRGHVQPDSKLIPDGITILPDGIDSVQLLPHCRLHIGCGFCLELPEGKELQIRSRSGLALKQGVIVINQPGTVDSGYRGEIGVILYNTTMYPVIISKGDKVAQAILSDVHTVTFNEVDSLAPSERSVNGFGSTGK